MIELYNPTTGNLTGSAPTLEGAPSVVTGTSRVSAFSRTLAVDASGAHATPQAASELSIIPLTTSSNAQNRPTIFNGRVVSTADYTPALAAGGLLTIFGNNLGSALAAGSAPLPTTLGGTCVTLNNAPIPLAYVTNGQINAEIPVGMAAGDIHWLCIPSQTARLLRDNLDDRKIRPFGPGRNGKQAAILHTGRELRDTRSSGQPR